MVLENAPISNMQKAQPQLYVICLYLRSTLYVLILYAGQSFEADLGDEQCMVTRHSTF